MRRAGAESERENRRASAGIDIRGRWLHEDRVEGPHYERPARNSRPRPETPAAASLHARVGFGDWGRGTRRFGCLPEQFEAQGEDVGF